MATQKGTKYGTSRIRSKNSGTESGKFLNVDDLMSATKELVNLSEDMDMLAEMKEWREMEKRLTYIKEEFGYDINAWNCVRNAFGDKGSLGSSKKLEINRYIAKITRIHQHSSASQGHMDLEQ